MIRRMGDWKCGRLDVVEKRSTMKDEGGTVILWVLLSLLTNVSKLVDAVY